MTRPTSSTPMRPSIRLTPGPELRDIIARWARESCSRPARPTTLCRRRLADAGS